MIAHRTCVCNLLAETSCRHLFVEHLGGLLKLPLGQGSLVLALLAWDWQALDSLRSRGGGYSSWPGPLSIARCRRLFIANTTVFQPQFLLLGRIHAIPRWRRHLVRSLYL